MGQSKIAMVGYISAFQAHLHVYMRDDARWSLGSKAGIFEIFMCKFAIFRQKAASVRLGRAMEASNW